MALEVQIMIYIYTEKINKIALSFSDSKRIQCSDNISTYPYDYNTKDVIDYNNLIDKEKTYGSVKKVWISLIKF